MIIIVTRCTCVFSIHGGLLQKLHSRNINHLPENDFYMRLFCIFPMQSLSRLFLLLTAIISLVKIAIIVYYLRDNDKIKYIVHTSVHNYFFICFDILSLIWKMLRHPADYGNKKCSIRVDIYTAKSNRAKHSESVDWLLRGLWSHKSHCNHSLSATQDNCCIRLTEKDYLQSQCSRSRNTSLKYFMFFMSGSLQKKYILLKGVTRIKLGLVAGLVSHSLHLRSCLVKEDGQYWHFVTHY
jgi:hypothetical protein